MAAQLEFIKYEGNGNDFIIFDLRSSDTYFSELAKIAEKLCDRNYGIGADGVIVLLNRNRMHVFNADGSIAKNCGNGLRCAAHYLFNNAKHSDSLVLEILDRQFSCRRVDNDEIEVDMGQATLLDLDEIYLTSIDKPATRARVAVGNDHLVIYVKALIKEYDGILHEVLQTHSSSTMNIGFLSHDEDGRLISRVYERGVGFTLACASGACAASIMLVPRENSDETSFTFFQPGGNVVVKAKREEQGNDVVRFVVRQRAKAREIFRGSYQISLP